MIKIHGKSLGRTQAMALPRICVLRLSLNLAALVDNSQRPLIDISLIKRGKNNIKTHRETSKYIDITNKRKKHFRSHRIFARIYFWKLSLYFIFQK